MGLFGGFLVDCLLLFFLGEEGEEGETYFILIPYFLLLFLLKK